MASAAADLAGQDNALVTHLDVTDPFSIVFGNKASIERFKLDAVITMLVTGSTFFETIPGGKIQRTAMSMHSA